MEGFEFIMEIVQTELNFMQESMEVIGERLDDTLELYLDGSEDIFLKGLGMIIVPSP